jgi:hypothetical protein
MGDPADAVVVRIDDKDIALAVHRDTIGVVEQRGSSLPVTEASLAAASERRDIALRRDLADAVAAKIGYLHVSTSVNRDANRVVEASSGARPVLMANSAVTREGAHNTVDGDLANAVVCRVGDVQVALRVASTVCRV